MARRKTVLVIDDHPVVLKGIQDLMQSSPDFEMVGEALTGERGLELARSLQPDLIVLDLRLPDCLAPDLCAELHRATPNSRVVILTAFEDRELVQACLRAGASGTLLKDLGEVNLLQSFQNIIAGQSVIDERLGDGAACTRRARQAGSNAYDPLTSREYDVLRLLAQGLGSNEIAERLALATNTVRSYTQSVLTKLHAHTRIQALAVARKLRLI